MKNEGPDVLEWVSYYLAQGADRIVVYTNDTTDGSDLLLDAMQQAGLVVHRRHQIPKGRAPQEAAADRLIGDPAYRDSRWALWVDADEFFLPLGDGRMTGLIARLEDEGSEALMAGWQNFGSSGHAVAPEGLVIENFTMTTAKPTRMSRTYKTLFRVSDRISELFIHRPIWQADAAPAAIAPDGRRLGNDFLHEMKENGRPNELIPRPHMSATPRAIVCHYAVKSLQQFRLKARRGDAMGNKGRFSDNYLNRFDINEGEDRRMAPWIAPTRARMQACLADPGIASAWQETRARRAALFAV